MAAKSANQISKHFKHVSLPEYSHDLFHAPAKFHHPNHALKLITQLQRHQMATVPFENLQVHYSRDYTISLDPGFLFKKIVDRGRAGYCTENNCFFDTILRSLGFNVFSAGARVNTGSSRAGEGEWEGWSHTVNIVTLSSGLKYMLDAGTNTASTRNQSGRQCTACPNSNSSPRTMRFMNSWTSQSRKSWFTYHVVALKRILEGEEVGGSLILGGGDVRRRVKGKTEHLRTCKTEEEWVRALEDVFGLRLTDEERRGIGGMVTELKG
ncbi:MAG: hypothetical protein Q9175_004780 [Cornicularia normoerica]